ncbi:hypothetical protein L208DRAFT_1416710, partial [Tricholoma matsutake]
MVQDGTLWCLECNNPEGKDFLELEYILAIQRYDDPKNYNSYPFAPHNFLVVHWPQIQFTWQDLWLVPYATG